MYLTVEETFGLMQSHMPKDSYLMEFGVFSGNTMRRLIEGAENANNPFCSVVGFDSFVGLPKESEYVWNNPEWPEGAFNLCKDYNLKSVDEAIDFVYKNIGRTEGISLIPGFFDHTLTKDLGKHYASSVGYAHIDVDIYSSSIQVLDWLFENNILQENAIIRFDDWLYNTNSGGNNLAFRQTKSNYNVEYDQVSDNVYIYKSHHWPSTLQDN